MTVLFFYHSLLSVAYYAYVLTNPSDSKAYFAKAIGGVYGQNWLDYFGLGTKFIDFITYGLVNGLGFTYESAMVLFSWFGYLGFLHFYIFFYDRLRVIPKLFGYNIIWIIMLLPNLHFWSSSLGKGSLIFFGFGMFFFALSKPAARFWALLLGGWIIFQIRPHIFYVVLIGIGIGYTFSTRGVAVGYRIAILAIAAFLAFYIYEDILALTGLEDESITDPLIAHRASELAKATSGIDLTNYSAPERLFTFLFRPLFFDAPGLLGWVVSFENLFYLLFFLQLLTPKGVRYLLSADVLSKTCFLTFLGVSFALSQISGNLGLALRQKSQVMILMMFVIVKYMEERRVVELLRSVALRRKRKEFEAQEANFSQNSGADLVG